MMEEKRICWYCGKWSCPNWFDEAAHRGGDCMGWCSLYQVRADAGSGCSCWVEREKERESMTPLVSSLQQRVAVHGCADGPFVTDGATIREALAEIERLREERLVFLEVCLGVCSLEVHALDHDAGWGNLLVALKHIAIAGLNAGRTDINRMMEALLKALPQARSAILDAIRSGDTERQEKR